MKSKKNLYKYFCQALALNIVIATPIAHAEVLLYHPDVDDLNIQAEIRTDNKRTSYDQFLSEQLVTKDLEARLLTAYSAAQRSFLAAEWTDVELRWSQVAVESGCGFCFQSGLVEKATGDDPNRMATTRTNQHPPRRCAALPHAGRAI